MYLNDIYSKLQNLKIPVAYGHMSKACSAPYVIYYENGGQNYGADRHNFIRKREICVNLYTKSKNQALEMQIEKIFSEFDLEVSEIYIVDEDLIQVSYSFTIIEKIK